MLIILIIIIYVYSRNIRYCSPSYLKYYRRKIDNLKDFYLKSGCDPDVIQSISNSLSKEDLKRSILVDIENSSNSIENDECFFYQLEDGDISSNNDINENHDVKSISVDVNNDVSRKIQVIEADINAI